jgi:hypothetical protein
MLGAVCGAALLSTPAATVTAAATVAAAAAAAAVTAVASVTAACVTYRLREAFSFQHTRGMLVTVRFARGRTYAYILIRNADGRGEISAVVRPVAINIWRLRKIASEYDQPGRHEDQYAEKSQSGSSETS